MHDPRTDNDRFVYAVAGPRTTRLVADLEASIGTATPQQSGAVQDAFNRACLSAAKLPEGPYNYLYEKMPRPGGEGMIVKCPKIDGLFYVPEDCTAIKKWEYEQALEMAYPTARPVQSFTI